MLCVQVIGIVLICKGDITEYRILNIKYTWKWLHKMSFYNIISKILIHVHSVPHNSNLLISNYRLFRRTPSAPKITPLTKICFTRSWLHQKFAYLKSKVLHLKFRVMQDQVYVSYVQNTNVSRHPSLPSPLQILKFRKISKRQPVCGICKRGIVWES